LSSLAAPKPTYELTEDERSEAAAVTAQAPAAIEMIEPSTGEIIVLAQHKPVAPAKAEEQVTPLAKPEKRTKGRAKLRTKPAEDGTTPMTATAKSDAGAQTGAKSAEVLAANAARKERKAAEKAKAKAKAKPARGEAKAGKSGSKAKKAR
jgi:hypothetical protein